MFPVGPSGHTWTAHAKSTSWLLHPSRCLRENRTARRRAFLCGCCLRGPVLRGAAVTQRRGFSCGVVCFLHLDFQALGRSVCAVLGASAVFFATDIRLALRHLLAALSRCTGASPCGEADVNGMSPSLCPPPSNPFMPDCPWEPCWPHWGCVLLGEPLLRLLRGAACPPPGPARGPGRAAAAIRLCLPHRPSLLGPVGSLGQSGSPRGQSQQDVHTERQMYFKEVAVWLRRPASPKSAGGLAGWGPGGAGSSCLIDWE